MNSSTYKPINLCVLRGELLYLSSYIIIALITTAVGADTQSSRKNNLSSRATDSSWLYSSGA